MKCTHLQALVERIINESPPMDWKPYDKFGDYQGYGNLVDGADPSNSGDVHEHGVAVGIWYVACDLARAIKIDRLEGEEK